MRGFAICGQIGAGKSTVQQYLDYAFGYHPINFSDALKFEAADIIYVMEEGRIPIDEIRRRLHDPEKKLPYRGLLQWLGSYRRSIDPNHWVDKLAQTEKDIARIFHIDRFSIADLRYDNEYYYVKKNGYLVVRVDRPDNPTQVGLGIDGHESEIDWKRWVPDITIVNAGTVENLHFMVEEMVYNSEPVLRR